MTAARFTRFALIATAIVATGCDESPTTAEPEFDPTALILATQPGGLPTTSGQPVGIRVSCPAGGFSVRTGTSSRSSTPDHDLLVWESTIEHQSCAHRIGAMLAVLDGVIRSRGEAHVRPNGQPADLLYLSVRSSGEITTTTPDGSITCVLDLVQTYDPAAMVHRLTGTSCGRAVNLALPLR